MKSNDNKSKLILLDEVELYYNLLLSENKDIFNDKNSEEISKIINYEFGVNCTGRDVFTIHEPKINDLIIDSEIHYGLFYD